MLLFVQALEVGPDLASFSELIGAEQGTSLLSDLDLSSAELGAPELLTLGSNGAIKQGLAVGLGVTLISRYAVARELRDGRLVEIGVPGTPLTRPWHVLFPPSGPRRPAVRAFGEFLRSEQARQVIEDYL